MIAPETAIPLLPDQLGAEAWARLTRAICATASRAALVGLPLGSFDAGYTNSVAGLSAQTAALPGGFYRYDKQPPGAVRRVRSRRAFAGSSD